jgi:hypothetical protein
LEEWLDVKEYADAEKILIEDELTNKDAIVTIINKVGIICILLEDFIFYYYIYFYLTLITSKYRIN